MTNSSLAREWRGSARLWFSSRSALAVIAASGHSPTNALCVRAGRIPISAPRGVTDHSSLGGGGPWIASLRSHDGRGSPLPLATLDFNRSRAGTRIKSSRPRSPTRAAPINPMTRSISRRKLSSTCATPASPATARPQSCGRAIRHALAPSASALTTSAPRRTPPSSSTGIFASTAATTAGRASRLAAAPSS